VKHRPAVGDTAIGKGQDGSDSPALDGQAALTSGRAVQAKLEYANSGGFRPAGTWALSELILASPEMWRDLADVEDEVLIADGYKAMARDLDRYAGY
jgi:hypothetical protein